VFLQMWGAASVQLKFTVSNVISFPSQYYALLVVY